MHVDVSTQKQDNEPFINMGRKMDKNKQDIQSLKSVALQPRLTETDIPTNKSLPNQSENQKSMQNHNESEDKFTYSVPTFNRFITLQDENPDFQRKHTTEKLKKSTGTSVTNEKSGRASDSNQHSTAPYQVLMLGKSHFKRLHAPHNHFVNNCEVMKRSTYDIKEATEVMSNMSALHKGNNKITELEQSYKGKVKTHKYINREIHPIIY
jgi:hypothetical protein